MLRFFASISTQIRGRGRDFIAEHRFVVRIPGRRRRFPERCPRTHRSPSRKSRIREANENGGQFHSTYFFVGYLSDEDDITLNMWSVCDIAALVLKQLGPMSAMKLQKLVYYAQAWSLALRDRPLFSEPIEAWSYGPVCPALYVLHRRSFVVRRLPQGDPGAVDAEDADFVHRVTARYARWSGDELSTMTHREQPWIDARCDVESRQPSRSVITHRTMREFYRASDPPFASAA